MEENLILWDQQQNIMHGLNLLLWRSTSEAISIIIH